ncbi:LPD38 domain-containing protein [Dysgonomonas sp. 511]|uniref:putative polyvalent protein kinase domain-containing protein n=1 Tax=Dysgonomonas sp. 511 TaxID=2302930 RepID=UPI0013D23E25|nr:LPD38 domain-containing protein [Dysgonomonas sp. 511]NDV77853.1 hypothetical protein [Dysgonomonas sp. 511]
MPIYESNGKKYNIPDDKVDAFKKSRKDAKLIDNTPYYLQNTVSTPRESNISKQNDTPAGETPVQQPSDGLAGIFTTFKDGTSDFIPSLKPLPRVGDRTNPVVMDGSLTPFAQGRPFAQTIQDTRQNMPASTEAMFDMSVDRYKIAGNTSDIERQDVDIEDKDLPPAAKEWLDRNKQAVTKYKWVGNDYLPFTEYENTPEQKAFIKDYIVNGEEGRMYAQAHKTFIEGLESEINPLLQQINNIQEATAKDREEYAKIHNISPSALKSTNYRNDALLDKASNLLKNAKLRLSANREGGGFRKGLHMTNEDIKELAVLTESFYNDKKLSEVIDKYQQDPNSLSKEENIIVQAKYIADQITAGVDPGSWYNIGQTTKESLPFMRDFMLTAPIGGAASNIVKGGASSLAGKTGANLLLSRGIGGTVSNLAKGAIDLSVRPAVQTMFSPSSYAMAYQEMQGQAIDRDTQGNILFDNRKDFSLTSPFIENQSEVMGEIVLDKLFQRLRIPLPAFLKTNAARRLSQTTGIQNPVSEYLEEKYSDLANIVRGEQTIEGFFDPRSNLETFGAVAIMQIPFTAINSTGYGIGKIRDVQAKRAAKQAYDKSSNNLTEYFGEDAEQAALAFNNLVDSNNEESLRQELVSVIEDERLDDNAKRAIVEYVTAYSAYSGMNRAKAEQIQQAQEEITQAVQENTNPQMNAVMSAVIGGYDNPMQVIGGNIVQNEDGSINRDLSDQSVTIIDVEGKRVPVSIKFVESISENIPTQDAIVLATEQVAAPIIAQQENEEVRPYEVGEVVTADAYDNGIPFTGQITEVTEAGNYIIVDTQNGQRAEIQPRQIINQDNIQGVDNGSLVQYRNEKGERVQGTVNDAYGLRPQGMMDIDGDIVAISDIIGLAEEETVQEETITNSQESEQKAQRNEQSVTTLPSEQNNLSYIEQIPQNESGSLLFEQVSVETTIGALNEVYSDAAELSGVVDATISNISKQIDKAKSPKPTGDITTDIANKQKANQQIEELNSRLSYWEGVRNVIQQSRPIEQRVTEQLTGEKEIVSLGSENNPEDESRTEIPERVPQGIHREIEEVDSRVEEPAPYNGRRETSTGEARQVVRGKGSKQEQLAALEQFAKENGLWIENTSVLGEEFSRGGENEVLYSPDTDSVFKLNNFEYAGDDVVNFFDRIDAHNLLFENIGYKLIGFARNSRGEVSAVVEQPYVSEGKELATPKQIADYMRNLGFEQIDEDTYTNGQYEVFDAFSNNVLLGADGLLYPIDTQIQKNTQEQTLKEKIDAAEAETDTNPTEAQKEAGNYKKGKVTIQGFNISIEQPQGSVRSGVDANGKEWSITMNNTYGYIRGTEGKDGDHIDVFLGNNPESSRVFVIDQVNQDGSFDEHKVMLGFESALSAKRAYLSNYEKGWQGLGNITAVDIDTFRKWTDSETRRIKPFAEYKEIQDANDAMSDFDISDYAGKELFHGSPDGEITTIDPYAHTQNWREGIGFYTTESRDKAQDYANGKTASKNRKVKKGAVTTITFPNNVRVLNMDAPVNIQMWNEIAGDLGIPVDNLSGSNMDTYNDLIAIYNDEHSANDGQYAVEEALLNYGYDASTHMEGQNSNPHRVFIWKNEFNLPYVNGVRLQSAKNIFKPVNERIFNSVISQLRKTGLARDIITDKAAFDAKLDEVINDNATAKQVQFMRTSVGDVYGFVTPDGTVWLDSTRMNANTPIHELGHLWNSFVKENNAELYNRGAELVKESVYWQRVNDNPSYRDLSDEAKVDEALAMAIGDFGELQVTSYGLQDKGIVGKIRQWVKDVWNSIRELFGFKTDVAIEDMTLSDFTRRAVRNLLEGKRLVDVMQPTVFSAQDISEMEQIKQSSIANGTFMLAPNGKSTKLNENQWLQVRTANFKNWFGDWINNPEAASKVVDENGEPMVVYHGTNQDFFTFSRERLGQNTSAQSSVEFFFTENVDEAQEYADLAARTQIRNAVEVEKKSEELLKQIEQANRNGNWDLSERLTLELEELELGAIRDEEGGQRIIEVFLNIRNPQSMNMNDSFDGHVVLNSIENAIEANKDGLMLSNVYDPVAERTDAYTTNQWVVFASTQIKSATENKGDFNSDMNDIRFQLIGEQGVSNLDKAEEATVRLDNLQIARGMESAEKDDMSIKLATGWERGADGKWRYEISDSQTTQKFKDLDVGDSIKLEEALIDETLFNAYPSLKDVNVKIVDTRTELGSWNSSSKTIELSAYLPAYKDGKFQSDEIFDVNAIDEGFRNVLLHEIQHAIQDIEGFAQGGNPSQFEDNYINILNSIEFITNTKFKGGSTIDLFNQLSESPNGDRSLAPINFYGKKLDRLAMQYGYADRWQLFDDLDNQSSFVKYNRLAGEVEARNVQSRMNMSNKERLNSLLRDTEDVSRNDQIFIYDSLGARESLDANIRFQSANDVADAANSAMTEDVRNQLDIELKRFRSRLREQWEDRYLPVKVFLDTLRKNGVDVSEHNDHYKQATHINGKVDAQLEHYNKTFQKPLNKAISDLEKAGFDYREIENYAILKHGLERNKWMRQDAINKYKEQHPDATKEQISRFEAKLPDDYSGITAVQKEVGMSAEEFIAEFENKAGKKLTDNFWKRVKDATKFSINKQLEGGLIDKKTFDDLVNRYDYYIPLRGHDAETAEDRWDYTSMGTYFVAPLVKAKGRKTRSESPFAYIFSMAQSSINSANRNWLNQTMLRLARKDTTGLMGVSQSWYVMDGMSADGVPTYTVQSPTFSENAEQYRENIEEFEERMQKLAEQGFAYPSGSKLDIGGMFIKRNQADQHEVHVWQNGKEYTVYINANPAVARAINGTNAKDLHKDLRFIAKVSRQMAANFTTRNPIFVATNFSRDYIFASSILPVKEDARYAVQFQRNIPRSAGALQRYIRGKADLTKKQDQYVIEYIMNGAKTGFSHIVELDTIQKRIEREIKNGESKNVFRSFLDILEGCNEFAENLSRLSVYITSREQGRSITQSISDAKEVTVNFNRSGAGGYGAAWFRSLYLFVNAGIQALSNFAKVAQKNKGKTAMLISGYAMTGFLMPMLTVLIGGDDGLDEYMKLSDWERQNNLCLYTGNGFIKIPLPHELRVFHAMGDNIYQAAFGKKDAIESFLDVLLGFSDLIPANPMGAVQGSWADIMPDATKPFFQLAANKNFTGGRITNEWADENKPGYLRVRTNKKGEAYAPAFLVKLAESLDNITGGDGVEKGLISFNPDEVNHILRGYFGGLYTIGTQVVTIGDKIYELSDTGEFKLKVRETPLKTFYTSADDLQTTSSGLNSKYFKISDDMQETRRKIKGYQEQTLSGDLTTEEFAAKINTFAPDIEKYKRLYPYMKQIKKYESALKDLDGEEQKEAERIIADMKKQVIEINSIK